MPAPRNTTPEAAAWRSERARLTRAVNSGDPLAVLSACEHFRREFVPRYGFTDFWANWARAAEDSRLQITRADSDSPAAADVLAGLDRFVDWIR